MELRKTFRFEASHILPKHPGKCSRLHGHSWVLHVSVRGNVNPETGFVMDYADISAAVKPIIDDLDHHHLGTFQFLEDNRPDDVVEIPERWRATLPPTFYPSSERLCWWIADRLTELTLPWCLIEIEETCTSLARLTKEEWLAFNY